MCSILFDVIRYLDSDGLVVGFICAHCNAMCGAGTTGVVLRVFLWDRRKKSVVCGQCFEKGIRGTYYRPWTAKVTFQTVTK